MRTATLLVLAASLLAPPALAQGDDKPSLLIMAFTADGVPGRSATSAEDLTAAAFSRTGRFNVIAGADLEQMMQLESNKAALGCNEGECIAEIADALGADFVVTGRISRLGELFVLKLSVLKPAEAKTMVTETFQVKSIEDLAFELSMAGQRMTLITFGEEVPDALKVSAADQQKKSDEEMKEIVDEAVKKQIEEQEASPMVLTLIYGGLGATGVGALGFVVTTVVMVAAYVVNGIWVTSPGSLKAIARPTGLVFSLIQPLFIVVALGGLTSLTFGYILE
jgi:TolB-like protein